MRRTTYIALTLAAALSLALSGVANAAIIDSGAKVHRDCTLRVKIDKVRSVSLGYWFKAAGNAQCSKRHAQTIIHVTFKSGGKVVASKWAEWRNSFGTGTGWVWTPTYRTNFVSACEYVQGVASFYFNDIPNNYVTTGTPIRTCFD